LQSCLERTCIVVIPLVGGFPSIRARCEWLPAIRRSVEWRRKPKEASNLRGLTSISAAVLLMPFVPCTLATNHDLCLCKAAWWAREDSNLQPSGYERRNLIGKFNNDQCFCARPRLVLVWLRRFIGLSLVQSKC
jgi:hypothetical protein